MASTLEMDVLPVPGKPPMTINNPLLVSALADIDCDCHFLRSVHFCLAIALKIALETSQRGKKHRKPLGHVNLIIKASSIGSVRTGNVGDSALTSCHMGKWRDVRDTDEHYVYSIALQNEP